MRHLWIAVLCLLALRMAVAQGNGAALLQRLQAMDVEHHWLADELRIDWHSGDPDPSAPPHDHLSTHCSAFVAAACERLGIYILRPPQHTTTRLANAQQDWLNSTAGAEEGWERIPDAVAARDRANQGDLVVASFKSPDRDRSGHIAIVIPSSWTDDKVQGVGCEIMQAGHHNYASTSLKVGFSGHHGAFDTDAIQFHAHVLPDHP